MYRRCWLVMIGILTGLTAFAQNRDIDPHKGDPARRIHTEPYPYVLPQQNYRVAPSLEILRGRMNAQKPGLFDERTRFRPPARKPTRGPRQDRDVTNYASNELQPVYTPNFNQLYISSNAANVDPNTRRLTGVGPNYRIWRIDLEGGNATQITGDVPEERGNDQFEPGINRMGNMLTYVLRSATGDYDIVVRNFTTNRRVQITRDAFEDHRPTLSPSGDLVAFSSNRDGGAFKIFIARTDGRPFDDGQFYHQLTFPLPGQQDLDPAWSPLGELIAFTRKGTTGESSIWIVNINTLEVFQQTSFSGAQDKQAAWSPNGSNLLFASNRKSPSLGTPADRVGTSFDIYMMISTQPEGPANLPVSLTRDPGPLGAEYPTPSQGVHAITGAIVVDRVCYQSNRAITNPATGEVNPGGDHDIFESLVFDWTPPTLEELPQVTPRLTTARGDIKVRARVTDFQSGVRAVYAQFKDPDSAEQDSEGEEHRVYLLAANRLLVDSSVEMPIFLEVGQQAINAQTYEYKDPYVLNPLGYSGSKEDALLLYDDGPASAGGHEPEGEKAGDGWYSREWETPPAPSDFYVDIIVEDNAGNEFVYDNIWGFSTKRFEGGNKILLVNDYAAGQMFVQTRGAPIGNNIARPTWEPTESYWTDNPTGKFPFDLANTAPDVIIGDGAFPHPRVLGAFIRADTLGANTPYGNLYDIWRVQCREPMPPSTLAGYLPTTVQEPVDLSGGTRAKQIWERMVIWASPYTGDLWAGPGTLLDLGNQATLRAFLSAGGRMVVSGQDIAWALALKGGISNDFLNQYLRAQFNNDAPEDVFLTVYDALRHHLVGVPATTGDPNPIANNPGGLGCWVRLEGGAFVRDEPSDLRLANVGFFQINPDGSVALGFYAPISQPAGPYYMDAAWNQVWIDTVSVNPAAGAPYRYTDPGTYLNPTDRAGFYYLDTTTKSKVVYFAFGMEGVNSTYNQSGIPNIIWCRSYRNKILENAFAWMTQSVLEGVVQQYDPEKIPPEYKPLPRALVRVTGLAPPSLAGVVAGYAITDSQGHYQILGLEPGVYLVTAERPGFRVQHEESIGFCHPATYTLNLVMLKVPPGAIAGRVVDVNTQPVQGATVTASSLDDPLLDVVTTTTEADGTFLLDRVPTGQWRVTADGTALGFRPGSEPPYQDVTVTSAQTVNVAEDFVLRPYPGTVNGKVIASDTNQGIAGALVVAKVGGTEKARVTTGSDGSYSLELDAGTYDLTATAPGYSSKTVSVALLSQQTVVQDIILDPLPPGSVTGKVKRKIDGTPESGVTIELLFSGQITQTTTTDTSGVYTFSTVPPGNYTVRGRKSGFTITPDEQDIVVNPALTTTVPDFLSEPLHTFVRGMTLVSTPYNYTQDVTALLNVKPEDKFRFFTWTTEAGRFIFYPTAPANRLELGRGYFMQAENNLALSIEGTLAPTNVPFEIPLKRGWNLIGNPYPFPITWSLTQVRNAQGTVLTNQQAVSQGLIAANLWGFSLGQYQTPILEMKPWLGYWLYALQDVTLLIPASARSRAVLTRAMVPANRNGWQLEIVASAGELADRLYVGVSRAAKDGFDNENDLLKPEPVGEEYLYLSVPHPDWGVYSGAYGMDIRSPGRAITWEFTVNSNRANAEITLRWPGIQHVSRDVNPVIVNLQTGERRYMRTTSRYSFRTGAQGGLYRFRIEMAPMSGLLRITNVQVNRGRAGNGTHTVSFMLTSEAAVQVNILANGRVIRSVTTGTSRSAGIQQVNWDGRNQSGVAMPPGQYTVEIKATSPDGQTARSVVPILLTR